MQHFRDRNVWQDTLLKQTIILFPKFLDYQNLQSLEMKVIVVIWYEAAIRQTQYKSVSSWTDFARGS